MRPGRGTTLPRRAPLIELSTQLPRAFPTHRVDCGTGQIYSYFDMYDLIGDIHGPKIRETLAIVRPMATFRDKDGNERSHTRVKWYAPPHGHTFRTSTMTSEPVESDLPLPEEIT